MKKSLVLTALSFAFLFPIACSAEGFGVGSFFHSGLKANGLDLVSVEFAGEQGRAPIGPQKMYENLLLAAGSTSTDYQVIPGEKIQAVTQSGETVVTSEWDIEKFNPFVILRTEGKRIIYAPIKDLSKTSYYDGSLGSYRYLQRMVYGQQYKDPMRDKYYSLYATRPKAKFTDCKGDLQCFINAAKTCKYAVLDRQIDMFGIGVQKYQIEIWGKFGKGDRCQIYQKNLGMQLAEGTYADEETRGLDGICTQTIVELVRGYENALKGVFTTDDTKTLDCHGLLFSRP